MLQNGFSHVAKYEMETRNDFQYETNRSQRPEKHNQENTIKL